MTGPRILFALAATCAPLAAHTQPPSFTEAVLVGEWDSGPCSSFVRGPGPEVSAIRRQ